MNHIAKALVAVITLALFSACSTYTGDSLLRLPEQSATYNQTNIISKATNGVSEILDSLGVSKETKNSFEKIVPENVIRDSAPLKLTHIDNQLVVSGAATNIAFATNSIIISTGTLHISHSGNNIVVCGSDIDISHDGSLRNGSLVISKGKTKISHARNTLIYAIKGVEISHPHNVTAFNTRERKTSWGHINNIIVEPLFQGDTASNKALPSPRASGR
jgi:hypothetical protein